MSFLDRIRRRLFPGPDSRQFVIDLIPRGAVCCEAGVWKGDFSRRILKRKEVRRLYLVDPWIYHEDPRYDRALYGKPSGGQAEMDRIHRNVEKRFAREVRTGRVRIIRNTSEAADLKDGELDWVYIDANHSYEYCRTDIRLYLAKVKPGGLVVLDDHSVGGWWGDGVIRAVNDAVARGGVEKVIVRNGQCVLRKLPPVPSV